MFQCVFLVQAIISTLDDQIPFLKSIKKLKNHFNREKAPDARTCDNWRAGAFEIYYNQPITAGYAQVFTVSN